MHLHKRVLTYVDVTIDANELITLNEAARILGISIPAVSNAIAYGRFTEIVDTDAQDRRYNRRFLLRSEVVPT